MPTSVPRTYVPVQSRIPASAGTAQTRPRRGAHPRCPNGYRQETGKPTTTPHIVAPTGSATERLWSAHDARGLGADNEFEAAGQLAMDAGYGVGLPGNRGVLTPYAGVTLGDAGARTIRTGTRWQFNPDTVVSVEATRQASDASEGANEVRLRAALRF